MKYLKLFKQINESQELSIDFSMSNNWNSSSQKDEEIVVKKFKWQSIPVTVINAEGEFKDEYNGSLYLEFSNGDNITYEMKETSNKPVNFPNNTPPFYNLNISINNKSYDAFELVDIYFGSTGTITGDILLIYKDFKDGKIK